MALADISARLPGFILQHCVDAVTRPYILTTTVANGTVVGPTVAGYGNISISTLGNDM